MSSVCPWRARSWPRWGSDGRWPTTQCECTTHARRRSSTCPSSTSSRIGSARCTTARPGLTCRRRCCARTTHGWRRRPPCCASRRTGSAASAAITSSPRRTPTRRPRASSRGCDRSPTCSSAPRPAGTRRAPAAAQPVEKGLGRLAVASEARLSVSQGSGAPSSNHLQPQPPTSNHLQPQPPTSNHLQPPPTTSNHLQQAGGCQTEVPYGANPHGVARYEAAPRAARPLLVSFSGSLDVCCSGQKVRCAVGELLVAPLVQRALHPARRQRSIRLPGPPEGSGRSHTTRRAPSV